jgi:hypothetical protein
MTERNWNEAYRPLIAAIDNSSEGCWKFWKEMHKRFERRATAPGIGSGRKTAASKTTHSNACVAFATTRCRPNTCRGLGRC